MELSCNLETAECATEEEVEAYLLRCTRDGAEEVWASHGEDEYPCLSLMMGGARACVHYLASEEEQYQSAGDAGDFGFTAFRVDGEQSVLPNDTLVSAAQAIACAKQFLHDTARPDCIEWNEL